MKAVSVFSFWLVAIPAFASQYFSSEDQIMIQQWVDNAGFEIYSINHHAPRQKDRWRYTQITLQALHTARPEQFYLYLSQLIISSAATGHDELTQLLKPVLNVNRPQEKVFNALILEKNPTELAYWLSHYMELETHLANNEDFYSKLLELLTETLVSNTQLCPEMSILESFKGVREKRHTVLQCIAQAVNLYIVDIDISHNRIATSKILGPEPVSVDQAASSATVLDNSENLFSTLIGLYDNPTLNPVILLSTPLKNGFLVVSDPRKVGENNKRPPVIPLTEADIDNLRQRHQGSKSNQGKQKNNGDFLSEEDSEPNRLEGWIPSPGFVIVASLAASVVLTLIMTMAPYHGNPWL